MEHANESSNHKINVKHVGQTGDDETRVTSLGQSKNIIQIIIGLYTIYSVLLKETNMVIL